jgi:signal transduction histidine kinase
VSVESGYDGSRPPCGARVTTAGPPGPPTAAPCTTSNARLWRGTKRYDSPMQAHASPQRADDRPGPHKRWRDPLTIRGTLFAGFSVVFVLWLASGLDLVRRTTLVQERAAAVNARAAAADQQLSTVRIGVLVASINVRDALLDPSPKADRQYLERLERARGDIDRALDAYLPVAQLPGERAGFQDLQAEIRAFWDTVLPVFQSELANRTGEARRLIRDELLPKRQMIFQISDHIQSLNRVALAQEQAEVQRIYSGMRRQIAITGGLALVASAVIAWMVAMYAGRMERRIREQMLKDAENTRDLQRLSARLVSAQEDERRTIARELHDEVGQALTAIKVELAVAGRGAPPHTREGVAFDEARRLTDHGLQLVRDLSQMLHPAMLDDLGLPETVAWYLNAFSKRTGIRVELVRDRMEERLASEIETCLYRIVQEALTNVARHAEAPSCRIYLQRLPRAVLLTVEDDGKGFPLQPGTAGEPRRGLGLLGIAERVSGFRGSLRIETAPGRGTRLTVELPALPRQQTPEDDAADVAAPTGSERGE